MIQPGANLYTQGFGSRPENVEVPHLDVRPPNANDVGYPIGKHWIDNVGLIEYTLVGQTSIGGNLQSIWDNGGNAAATTTTAGIVSLSTLAQLEAGTAPAGAVVPLANDVFTFVNSVAIAGATAATTAAQGIVYLATNADAVTPYATPFGANTALVPGNITPMFASPPAIGGTSAAAGSFTTLATSGLYTGSASATINTAGTALNLGTDASGDAINIGTVGSGRVITVGDVTGATGIVLIVGTGNFSLNGVGASTYIIGAATTGGTIKIGGTAMTGTLTLGSSSGTNTQVIAGGAGATTLQIANAQVGGSVSVGTGMVAGTISVGGTAQTGNMTLGSSSATNTQIIAGGAGATTLQIANVQNAGSASVGAGMTIGTISIGGTLQTGAITLGASTAGQTVNISSASTIGTGNTVNLLSGATPGASQTLNIMTGVGTAGTYAVNILTGASTGTTQTVSIATGAAATVVGIGNATGASSLTLKGGTGGIVITPVAGNISMAPATSSGAGTTLTLNDRFISWTITGLTTASAGVQSFVLTNSNILTTSALFVTVTNLDASGNHAKMGLQGVRIAASSVSIDTVNNGAGALGAGDNVLLSVWVMS